MNFINSLTARIFAIFWLTLALVLVIVLMLPKFDNRQLTDLSEKDRQSFTQMQKDIESFVVTHAFGHNEQMMMRRNRFSAFDKWHSLGMRIVFVSNEGRIHGASAHDIKDVRNFISLSDNPETPKNKRYQALEISGPFVTKNGPDGFLYYILRSNNRSTSNIINSLIDHPFFLLTLTMLISTPLLLWLAWSLAKPARRLRTAADMVAQGNLKSHPELEYGPVEFKAVGISFNQMIKALERMVDAQQRLLSDISHELRTPLTRLQLATALLRRKQGESSELTRIETESSRLDCMISSLLTLSRNSYKNELDREYLFADELWEDVLENAQFEAEQINKSLEIVSPPEKWSLFGNRHALDSALENLIRNALKYSKNKISVIFHLKNEGVQIFIDDDGTGVKEEDREQIFRPFYRTDEARDRDSGGNGLGLAIVKSAINQHNGTVKAEQSPLGGLRINLWLPIAKK